MSDNYDWYESLRWNPLYRLAQGAEAIIQALPAILLFAVFGALILGILVRTNVWRSFATNRRILSRFTLLLPILIAFLGLQSIGTYVVAAIPGRIQPEMPYLTFSSAMSFGSIITWGNSLQSGWPQQKQATFGCIRNISFKYADDYYKGCDAIECVKPLQAFSREEIVARVNAELARTKNEKRTPFGCTSITTATVE